MLQAMDKNEKRILPAELDRAELDALKMTGQPYFCPECKEPVILKAGMQVIPHFAHRKAGKCGGGGEGTYHETGKWLLYKWLSSQGLNVQLEASLPEIGRRPDILLTVNSCRIAIEYQCAAMNHAELLRRMLDYEEHNMEQIWILGGNRFKRIGSSVLSIDRFTQQFLHFYDHAPNEYFYFFCPETFQLATFQNPVYSTAKRAFGSLQVKKLNECKLTDLFKRTDTHVQGLGNYWLGEKKRFRLSAGDRAFGTAHQFRQWLYLKGLHVETLPACIGLPVRNADIMKLPVFDWQSRLVMELTARFEREQIVPDILCTNILNRSRIKSKTLPIRRRKADPVKEYMNQLEQLGYVERIEGKGYSAGKRIELYRNVEQSIYEDELLMKEWFQMMKKRNQMKSMIHANSAIL